MPSSHSTQIQRARRRSIDEYDSSDAAVAPAPLLNEQRESIAERIPS